MTATGAAAALHTPWLGLACCDLQGPPQTSSGQARGGAAVAPRAPNKITSRNNYVYNNIDNAQQPWLDIKIRVRSLL